MRRSKAYHRGTRRVSAADKLGVRVEILRGPAIIMVRHGYTSLNGTNSSAERIRGWTDVPLNEEGHYQAERLGRELAKVEIEEIHCSNLSRAEATAKAIQRANVNQPPVEPTPLLRPWNLGIYQGKPAKEATKELEVYVEHPDREVPRGESFDTFSHRCLVEFIGPLMAHVEQEKSIECVVTHSRVLRRLRDYVSGRKPTGKDMLEEKQAEPGEFEIYRIVDNRWKLTKQ